MQIVQFVMIGGIGGFYGDGLAVVGFGIGEFSFHEGVFGELTKFACREIFFVAIVVVI